jgi:NADP-dependent 3-hydroxy acid dehydrogenase YdfG
LHETAPLPHCLSYIHGLRRRHERQTAQDPTEAGGKPLSTQPLAGKTALVTGGSRNIGRAIALRLAGAGADIIVNTLQDRAAADRVAGEIAALGRKSLVQVADIVDRKAVRAMVEEVAAFGSIDILVCSRSTARSTARRHSCRA